MLMPGRGSARWARWCTVAGGWWSVAICIGATAAGCPGRSGAGAAVARGVVVAAAVIIASLGPGSSGAGGTTLPGFEVAVAATVGICAAIFVAAWTGFDALGCFAVRGWTATG